MIAALAILFLSLPSPNSAQNTSFKCPCGVDDNYNKIIKSGEKPHPWYVFVNLKPIRLRTTYRCGATLLNREWVVTAAHCVCNDRIGFKCVRERGRLVRKYGLGQIEMFLGVAKPIYAKNHIDYSLYRGAKTIVVHDGYKQEMFDESYNDIALIKFDRPFDPAEDNIKTRYQDTNIMPICLPHSNKFKDEDKQGLAVGWNEKVMNCITNGIGPDIHQPCAKTTIYSYNGKPPKKFNLGRRSCITHRSPSMDHGTPCYYFHKNQRLASYFQPNTTDEIVLMPEGKGMKDATSCMRSEDKNKLAGKHGWCGTIPPNGDFATVAKPTVDSGWGYCTDDCKIGLSLSALLKTVNLDLLRSSDCQLLLKGTNATEVLDKKKQLCAGFKIKKPSPLFFTYSGEGKGMVFKKMAKPLKGWKQAQMSTVPGLDFMIRGRFPSTGDSGGPLWVREKEKGESLPIAYLVGITAWNHGGIGINKPGRYVRVKNYLEWIRKHAASGGCSKKVQAKKTKKTAKRKKKPRRKKKKKSRRKKKKKSGRKKKKKSGRKKKKKSGSKKRKKYGRKKKKKRRKNY